jgi:GT2 family glycosyltransferase
MEAAKKIKVYCSVPTTGAVSDSQTYFWRATEKKYGDRVEFIWPEQCWRRIFHDFARNEHVEQFLKSDADILFFLDSDVTPPEDLFDLVIDHEKWKLAGAAYPVFITPAGYDRPQVTFTVYKGKYGGGLGSADMPQSGTEFVDGLATGCMFIKREVFAQLEKPYFEFKYDPTSRLMIEGEDLGFCKKVGSLGFRFYTDYAKVCKHYKSVCLLEVNNYAMEYAKRSVEQYDNLIKPQINELVNRLKKPKSKLLFPKL